MHKKLDLHFFFHLQMNLNWNGVMILIQKMTEKWLNYPELAAPKRANKLQFKIH